MTVRLDIAKILYGAFMFPLWHRHAFARALAIPLVLLVTFSLSWYYGVEYLPKKHLALLYLSASLLYAMFGVLFSLFAVTCHRLVLLDAESVASRFLPHWSWRETRFFLWLIAFWIVLGATILALTMAISILSGLAMIGLSVLARGMGTSTENWAWVPFVVATIPAFYLFARLCLVFPATAIDRKVDLKWAWRLTQGNGWRLVVVVALLPWLISEIVSLLYRANATAVETVILTFLGCALFAVEVAAVSLSYRELTREEA